MFGGNIGNEKRSANREPTDLTAGKKIILGGSAFFCKIKTDAKNNGEINSYNYQVRGSENTMRYRHDCCRQHRTSWWRLQGINDYPAESIPGGSRGSITDWRNNRSGQVRTGAIICGVAATE